MILRASILLFLLTGCAAKPVTLENPARLTQKQAIKNAVVCLNEHAVAIEKVDAQIAAMDYDDAALPTLEAKRHRLVMNLDMVFTTWLGHISNESPEEVGESMLHQLGWPTGLYLYYPDEVDRARLADAITRTFPHVQREDVLSEQWDWERVCRLFPTVEDCEKVPIVERERPTSREAAQMRQMIRGIFGPD